jgi:hypothetical protein
LFLMSEVLLYRLDAHLERVWSLGFGVWSNRCRVLVTNAFVYLVGFVFD